MAKQATARSIAGALAHRFDPRLVAAPPAVRKTRIAELESAARSAGITALEPLLAQKEVGAFIASVMEYAPFLRSLILDEPQRLADVLATDPTERLATITAEAGDAWRERSEAELMSRLRGARQEVALLVALADLGGVFDLREVTQALSAFADAAVSSAVNLLLRDASAAGRIVLRDPANPATGSGWIVLGMGKLGA